MQPHVPGELLTVRGAIWRLRSQTLYADCTELDLEPAPPGADGDSAPAVLLEPFDRPEPLSRVAAPTGITRRRWMVALLDALAGERRCDLLSAPITAAIDVLPFQLEPALVMAVRGVPRVLLADAVGLGKTIQAALVITELFARRTARRALVLTPSGLRDQWAGELRDRFGLDPTIVDAVWLRAARADLPASVNPWSVGDLIVASIDLVKRPEVVRSLEHLRWDIVVIDEAHAASSDSQRRAAAHALARRARRVLLLTATPHSGDRAAFDALCGIGAVAADEPIVMFRRSRADVGLRISRHVHLLPVRRGEAERELHRRLLAYVRKIWRERGSGSDADARLATIVLLKRAFSSTTSLAESLEFRLAHLADPAAAFVAQLELPLDPEASADDDTPVVSLVSPGFDDEPEERQTLASLVELARSAVATDSKIRVLTGLLGRVSEPCIVFTEYRDTLMAIERVLPEKISRTVLHGGLDRPSRADAVRQFVSGAARVLLATDAGGEGLNLQATCRLVVNLELPWNPVRLEQRIGRVDRIGQQRTVHAINLVAAATFEANLLARLGQRLEYIRDALGSVDEVLGPGSDIAIAGLMAECPDAESPWSLRPAPTSGLPPSQVQLVTLDEDIRRQTAQLLEGRAIRTALARRTRRRGCHRGMAAPRCDSPKVAAVSMRRLRDRHARTGALAVYRTTTADEGGRLVDGALLPLFTPFMLPHLRRRSDVVAMANEWLATYREDLDALALKCATERLEWTRDLHAREVAAGFTRSCAQSLVSIGDGLMIQGGLFDRRTERSAEQRERETESKPTPWKIGLAERPELQLILMVTP